MKKFNSSVVLNQIKQYKFSIAITFIILFTIATFKSLTMFLFFINVIGHLPNHVSGGMNVLVVGTDNVQGSKRSDVIAVVHFNEQEKKVRLLSIPRDTRVNIPDIGISKINHAYAHGGIALLNQTVAEFLSIPIHKHFIVKSDGVEQMIDAIGGVKVTIENDMLYDDFAGNLHINLKAGERVLNGNETIKYLRYRNDSKGDIGRIARQQNVMSQLFDQVFNLRTLIITPKLLSLFKKSIKTDIEITQMSKWLNHFIENTSSVDFATYTIPGTIRIIDGVSYWRPNMVYLDKLITKTFDNYAPTFDTPTAKPERSYISKQQIKRFNQQLQLDKKQFIRQKAPIKIEVLNGNGFAGVATKAAKFLNQNNLRVVRINNSESFNYESTVIVDWKGNLQKSMQLAKLLQIDESNIVVYDRKDKPLDITLVLGKDLSNDYLAGLDNEKRN
ncbi:MAG: LCP family protein [Candidatus Marinamargulisbacteria bacterium]